MLKQSMRRGVFTSRRRCAYRRSSPDQEPRRQRRNVSLLLNGKSLESKTVKLTPGGRATVEFFLPDAAYGMNRGEVRIDSRDKLAADDTYPFSIERKEARRILLVHEPGRTRAVEYYKAALESTPDAGFTVDAVSSDQASNLDFNKYAFVVLSDTIAANRGLLETRWWGVGRSRVECRGSMGTCLAQRSMTRAMRHETTSDSTRRVTLTNPIPSVARVSKFDDVKFYQVVRIDPAKGKVVAKFTDGSPLLLEKNVGAVVS